MEFVDFGLVLTELKKSVSRDKFAYLLSALQTSILELTPERSDRGTRKIFMRQNQALFDPFPVRDGEEEVDSISQDHINLSSLKRSQRNTQRNDMSCSHLPVCRKIISKIILKFNAIGIGTSNSSSLSMETRKSSNKTESLAPLIGKISNPILPPPSPYIRKRRSNKGVFDLTHSISNPLYKNYNPKGFVKSEDAEAREFIENIVIQFNSWLRSLQGDIIQVEPQVLIKIVRDDLEIPDPSEIQNIERVMRISNCTY